MITKTNVKAGGLNSSNHNETLRGGLKLRTNVKAGGTSLNHNESLRGGLKLRTNVKAGGISVNHNESIRTERGVNVRTGVRAGAHILR